MATDIAALPVHHAQQDAAVTLREYKGKSVEPEHYGRIINTACAIDVTGLGPQLIYLPLPSTRPGFLRARAEVAATLPALKYVSDYRTDGLKTNSRTFGLAPRNTLRHDYCSLSSLDWEQPALRRALIELARGAHVAYQQHVPNISQAHREWASGVHPHWRLGDTPWTSGIINANNPLKYHVDSGNWPAGWSAQFTWRGDTTGGLLVFPQLHLALDLGEGSLLLFNGGLWVHGVTPIKKLTPMATRYSLVLYARQGAVHCGTPQQEAQRIQQLRTQREIKRGQKNGAGQARASGADIGDAEHS